MWEDYDFSHFDEQGTFTGVRAEDDEFKWYDYLIFAATLIVSLGIGIYSALSGGGQKTTKEYLMANRSLGTIPVALSMFMSYISAILVLGNTAEMYQYGVQQWLAMFGSSIAYFLAGIIFVPLFFPLKVTSSFEYLQKRFDSSAVKLTGTFMLMISQVMYMGIAIYSPATALESVSPIPEWAAMLATGVIATIYTTIGGMKAVVYTDVFQALVLLGGVIAVLIVGLIELGGFGKVFEVAGDMGRLDISFSLDPTLRMTFWSVMIGRTMSSLQTTGTGQTSVQRYCSLPTIRQAKWSVWLNIPLIIIVYSLTCLVGLTVFAYYSELGCDPLRDGTLSNSNQLLPYFIVSVLRTPGLPGLFVAVLFSGALSTISSSMNSLAAVTWKDMMEWKYDSIPEWKKAAITKFLALFYGILALGFAFVVRTFSGHVLQLSQSFVSGTAGPLLGLFILGSFFPCANKIGALTGAWVGLIFNLIVIIGNNVSDPHREKLPTNVYNCSANATIKEIPTNPDDVFPLFTISYMYFSALGSLVCVGVGLFTSMVSGYTKPETVNPHYFVPFFDRLFCCLPRSCREKMYCGVHMEEAKYNEDGHILEDAEEEMVVVEGKDGISLEEKTNHMAEKSDHVAEKSDHADEKTDHVTDKSDHVVKKADHAPSGYVHAIMPKDWNGPQKISVDVVQPANGVDNSTFEPDKDECTEL